MRQIHDERISHIHSVLVSFMQGQTLYWNDYQYTACVNAEMKLSFVIDIRNPVCYNINNELRVFYSFGMTIRRSVWSSPDFSQQRCRNLIFYRRELCTIISEKKCSSSVSD